jgi:hypothetical protein
MTTRVRVEDASTSLGRTYTSLEQDAWQGKAVSVKGLGEQRRQITTKSFSLHGRCPVLESLTMASVNLRTATTEDVLAYFENTWALTDTLFSALKNDSSFYAIPDKLRRPLVFYFAHPAALYINKLHQAGLVGEFLSFKFEKGREEGEEGGVQPAFFSDSAVCDSSSCVTHHHFYTYTPTTHPTRLFPPPRSC